MKNKLRISLIIAALGVIFGCAGSSYAQQPMMVGGWRSASVTDKEVLAAANYAVAAEAKKMGAKIRLVSINAAEQQLVAGMNYKVCLNVEMTKRGKKAKQTQTVQTVVYKNLKQKYSLTEWTPSDCQKQG